MTTKSHAVLRNTNAVPGCSKLKLHGISSMAWRAFVVYTAAASGPAHGACPDPPITSCTINDACSNHLVKLCANGPNVGKDCVDNGDCSGYPCRESWREYFIDAGTNLTCANAGFGGAGADGVDVKDFDGDGDIDIVTGWEESGITYVYRNPCNPPNRDDPTSCANPGAVLEQWRAPWGLDPMDVRGGVGTESIEDAAFADFNRNRLGVVTATEGGNQHVKLHGMTSAGNWLGASLPGEKNAYMQVRAADINGDGCADIVAGSKLLLPDCYNPTPIGPQGCALCEIADKPCADVAALWWWECPASDGPFGPGFDSDPPQIDVSGWTKRKIDDGFSWIMGIELTDMDGDGDKDVLYSDRREIGWFENRTSPAQGGNLAGWGTPIRIDTMANILARKDGTEFSSGEPFRFLAYGDVDGDGLKDVVATASFHKGFCSATNNIVCATNADCPVGEDCNNNGDRFAGYFYRRLNASGQSWQINPILVKGGLPNSLDAECDAVSKGVAIGDVTGDGRTDLVFSVRGAGHSLYSLSYDPAPPGQCGPCVNHEWNSRPISPCRSVSKYDNVQLADIDRDGLLDVVSAEENFPGLPGQSSGLGVVWYRNLGFCGNGRIDSDEECDNGVLNGAAGQCCDTSCRVLVQQVCRAATSQCDAPEYCTSGSGACPADSKQPQGTPCAISQCDTLPYQCDGNGSCSPAPGGAQPCTIDQQCPSGLCLATDICAASCPDDGNPCTYDVCNGGICQHPPKPSATLCGDDGNECTIQQCNGAGTCQTVFHGTLTSCGELPTQPCDALDLCNGAGSCVRYVKPAGQVCRPSARGQSQGFCDPPETCDGVHKQCPPDLTAQVGAVCADPPPRSCDADELICYGYCEEYQCDASHYCALTGINPGTICYEDGNECSVHTCISTSCFRSNVLGPCADDGNECTADVCRGIECAHYADPNADLCNDDGNPCTDDVCMDGQCAHVPVPGRACNDDGNECTENVCGDDGHCYPPLLDETPCSDDGLVCTDDFCVAGVCEHPAQPVPIACESDNKECTKDVCMAGACEHLALVGESCTDEGNECTTDVCDGAGQCSHSAVPDGQPCTDDGNICKGDVCVSGACAHPPEVLGFACGSPSSSECDAPDGCDGAGVCVHNHVADQTACTPDGLDCTIDECRQGLCVHAAELPLPTDETVEPLCGGLSLLPALGSPDDVIRAFAVFDDGNGEALYAGGTMLHKWDGATWTQIDTPIADTILTMEVADLGLDYGDSPALYIGGRLVDSLDGPQPLRRWDGTTWTDLGPFNGPVHALKAAGGVLYVGGAFTTVDFTLGNGTPVNGFVVNHIAKIIFLDPPTWEALGTGTNDTVHALAWGKYGFPDFDLLGVGGAFTTAGGLTASGFAYWGLNSFDGGGWSTVDPLLPPEGGGIPVVYAIAAFAPYDYLRPFNVGGLFRVPEANSPTGFSNNVARLLGVNHDWFGPDGGRDSSGGSHAVRSIAPAVDQSGPAIFVGGEFGTFNGVAAAQIVRISGATHSLGSCLNGSVEAMISFNDGSGDALYVGGLFTDSNQQHFVARWRALPGDLDGNGIVTERDFTVQNESAQGLLICITGPEPWQSATGLCGCSDLDHNGRVDMRDVAALMNLMGTTN